MPKRKLNYSEGDWFAVPLRDGGFAVGIVARMDGRGGVVGYFFGPRRSDVPTVEEVDELGPDEAAMVRQFGDLRLLEQQWPLIGRSPRWDRDRWPIPAFGRIEELSGRAWRVEYADDDLNRPIRETPVSQAEAEALPRDGALGAGAVELVLTSLLLAEL